MRWFLVRKKRFPVRRRRVGTAIAIVVGLGCGSRSQLAEETRTRGAADACARVACTRPPSCFAPTGTCTNGACAPCDDEEPCTTGDACRTGVIAVSAGGYHTCALTAAGAVKCWGTNTNGQLGDRSTIDRPVPVDVVGLSCDVLAISTGVGSACALTAPGAVKCWGANTNGQLGDGSTIDRSVPVDVVDLSSDVSAVSARGLHTCALTAAGAVKCWGFNGSGELGNDSYVDSPVPVDVVGLSSDVLAVSAGGYHTCALTTAGAIKCWGANGHGELGNKWATPHEIVPVDVVGLSSSTLAVSAGGYHTCALTAPGAVKCWGWNQDGQLGNNSYNKSPVPVPVDVVGLSSGIVAVSAGWEHTCALTTAGAVKCWGANGYGELGNGSTTFSNVPVDVVGLSSGVIAISAGANHTCALTAAGAVKCWGWNQYGQLGNNSTTDSPVPVDVGL